MRFWDNPKPADVGSRYGTAGEGASYMVLPFILLSTDQQPLGRTDCKLRFVDFRSPGGPV